jgi:outer membrane protein assembly factor BamB
VKRSLAGILTCAVLLTAALAANAAEPWPRLRGPNGTGHAEGGVEFPATWTDADYAWKVDLPGGGHGSPAIWGDRVFLTCADEKTAKRIVVCISLADGKTLWTREFESTAGHLHGLNSYATTTPALDEKRCVVAWATPERYDVVALDHEGKDLWRRELGPFVSQHGHGASPMIAQGLVIVPNDQDERSFIVALDPADGGTRWLTPRKSDRAAYSTPCLYEPQGGPPQLIFTASSCGMTGVEAATGKVLWEVPEAFPERVVSGPVWADGVFLGSCGTGSKGRHLIAIRPPDAATGRAPQVAWKMTDDAPYVPTATAVGDRALVWTERGTVTCVKAATGEVLWRERIGSNFYGSAVLAGGKLYAITTSGMVYVIGTGEKYELLGRNALGEKSQATPAVSGDRMLLRTWTKLYCLKGKEVAK